MGKDGEQDQEENSPYWLSSEFVEKDEKLETKGHECKGLYRGIL